MYVNIYIQYKYIYNTLIYLRMFHILLTMNVFNNGLIVKLHYIIISRVLDYVITMT